MGDGRKGRMVKWLGGLTGTLLIGLGNVVGTMIQRMFVEGGMAWESAGILRWLVAGGVWMIGLLLAAVIYGLGAALEKIDVLESWIVSMDTAVRNQNRNE